MPDQLTAEDKIFLESASKGVSIGSEYEETEENDEAQNTETAETAENTDLEAAEIERAKASGWKPIEEYKGPKGKWRDYKEFNEVGDRITKTLESKIASQEDVIKKLIEAQSVIIEQAKQQALAELSAQKREAIRDGDVAAVDDIDKKIATVTEEHEKAKIKQQDPERVDVDQATVEFVAANQTWFGRDQVMTNYATLQEQIERSIDPSARQTDILDRVKQAVVARFPDKFSQKRTGHRSPAVESGSVAPRASEVSFEGYPDEVRKIADYFERTGAMSKKDYLAALKRGGVSK